MVIGARLGVLDRAEVGTELVNQTSDLQESVIDHLPSIACWHGEWNRKDVLRVQCGHPSRVDLKTSTWRSRDVSRELA
jgi:hypothetical protein